jgi:hypothetical protein
MIPNRVSSTTGRRTGRKTNPTTSPSSISTGLGPGRSSTTASAGAPGHWPNAGSAAPPRRSPAPRRPNVGVTGGGTVLVSLKPGIVNTIPVTKKQFKGESPRVAIRDVRVKIDGCVGESFIRSYAVLARVTDEKDSVLAWYAETTRV